MVLYISGVFLLPLFKQDHKGEIPIPPLFHAPSIESREGWPKVFVKSFMIGQFEKASQATASRPPLQLQFNNLYLQSALVQCPLKNVYMKFDLIIKERTAKCYYE